MNTENPKRSYLIKHFSKNTQFNREAFDKLSDETIDEMYEEVHYFIASKSRTKTKLNDTLDNAVVTPYRQTKFSHPRTKFGEWYNKRYGLPADNMKQYMAFYRLYKAGALDIEKESE